MSFFIISITHTTNQPLKYFTKALVYHHHKILQYFFVLLHYKSTYVYIGFFGGFDVILLLSCFYVSMHITSLLHSDDIFNLWLHFSDKVLIVHNLYNTQHVYLPFWKCTLPTTTSTRFTYLYVCDIEHDFSSVLKIYKKKNKCEYPFVTAWLGWGFLENRNAMQRNWAPFT